MNTQKSIFITGVSGLIGSNIAKYLLSQGYMVFGCISSKDSLAKDSILELKDLGMNLIICDLNSKHELSSLIDSLKQKNIFGFLHCARSLGSLNIEQDGTSSDINLSDEYFMQVILPYKITTSLVENGLKRTILFGSQYGSNLPSQKFAGDNYMKYPIQYGLAKSAQKRLAIEISARYVIKKFNCFYLSIGGVYGKTDDKFNANYAKLLPLKRLIQPYELFPAIDLCLDIRSSAMIGSELRIDGGYGQ